MKLRRDDSGVGPKALVALTVIVMLIISAAVYGAYLYINSNTETPPSSACVESTASVHYIDLSNSTQFDQQLGLNITLYRWVYFDHRLSYQSASVFTNDTIVLISVLEDLRSSGSISGQQFSCGNELYLGLP